MILDEELVETLQRALDVALDEIARLKHSPAHMYIPNGESIDSAIERAIAGANAINATVTFQYNWMPIFVCPGMTKAYVREIYDARTK